MSTEYADEFPLLASIGLYATPTSGEGNCLFHALSDQLYGTEDRHQEIRARVVQHMASHRDYFVNFLSVPLRRAPKRKATTGGSNRGGKAGRGRGGKGGRGGANTSSEEPMEVDTDALDKAFDQHLKSMARLGTYGDNMEISAFAREYGVDVKVYQMDLTYVLPRGDYTGPVGSDRDYDVEVVYIAYHSWEHYSSIRNIDGPHTGLPRVQPKMDGKPIPQIASQPVVKPWMIETAKRSLTFIISDEKIKDAIIAAKGNVNAAVDKLLQSEDDSIYGGDEETRSVSHVSEGTSANEDMESLFAGAATASARSSRSRTHSPTGSPSRVEKKGTRKGTRSSPRLRAKELAKKNAASASGAGASGPPLSKKKKRELMKASRGSPSIADSDGGGTDTDGSVVHGIRELYV